MHVEAIADMALASEFGSLTETGCLVFGGTLRESAGGDPQPPIGRHGQRRSIGISNTA
jgi:hypothetical protein